MNFLGFGQSAEIDIIFDGDDTRQRAEIKGEDGKIDKYLLYYDGETVSGKVNVTLKKPGSKLEHQGIKIEFIGQIELFYDRGNHHEFKGIVKALARPGDLLQNTSYPFEFPNVEKSFEVYAGSNVRLRYFLRATIVRRLSDITREVDIAVHTLCTYPDMNNPIKMEVGIEDCLHIEFEYNKSKYHLKDVIVGKIYFLLVRIKIKHMEIAIIKRESTGSGPNMFTENETIAKYEIMDGAPVKGESIPIRVFLAGYSLTPTMRDINKKFSVKYFLNLVLMDTEDRRYFKQQEITLWRKADKPRKTQNAHASNHPHAPTHLVGSSSGTTGNESDMQSRYDVMAGCPTDDGGVSPLPGPLTTSGADSKMGLFTRESPQQEFSRYDDTMSSTRQTASSAVPCATSPTTDMLRRDADDSIVNSKHIESSRQGIITPTSRQEPGSKSVGNTTSHLFEAPTSILVSTTPPPLPVTSASGTINHDTSPNQEVTNTSVPNVPSAKTHSSAGVIVADTAADEMVNVPLSTPDAVATESSTDTDSAVQKAN